MTWNHRVIRHTNEHGSWYAVHEVYYNEAGVPDSWTSEPINLVNDTMEDMREELSMIQRCLDKPILEIKGDNLQVALP